MSGETFSVFSNLLWFAPLFIIWSIGLILAFGRRSENPKRYNLVIIAMIVFLFNGFLGFIANVFLPVFLMKSGMGYQSYGWIFTVKGVFSTLFSVVGWTLILMAMFKKESE